MKKNTYQYCLDILNLPVKHKVALANLVMALASHKSENVVGLSESPVYHYQYSSIQDAITHLAADESELLEVERQILIRLLNDYWINREQRVILQTDKTVAPKPHSKVLKNRLLINIPNQKVPGNKPLSIGLEYSFINLVADEGRWSLPLSGRNIPLDQSACSVAAEQTKFLVTCEELPFHKVNMVVNTLDSGYAGPIYLDAVKHLPNLVSVVRLRKSSKVYLPANKEQQPKSIYGARFFLILKSGWKWYKKHPKTKLPYRVWRTAITEQAPDTDQVVDRVLKNGRKMKVRIRYWQTLIMRTKKGIAMKDKPFSLVCIEAFDAKQGHMIFKNPMFVAAFGKKRLEITGEEIYDYYHKRYGIEPFFGFIKRNMHAVNFKALSTEQLNKWMYIIILAVWLLFTARKAIPNRPKKWQTYAASEIEDEEHGLTLYQAFKSVLPYLLSFDSSPFLPPKSKPGPGRLKGQSQTKRTEYPYAKKTTNDTNNSTKKARAGP